MNDLEMIEKIQLMHHQMKALCLQAGIGKARYKRSIASVRKLIRVDLEKRYKFFESLNRHWMEYKRIWDQHTQQEWEQLRILTGGSLREQKALKQAAKELCEYWGDNFVKAIK